MPEVDPNYNYSLLISRLAEVGHEIVSILPKRILGELALVKCVHWTTCGGFLLLGFGHARPGRLGIYYGERWYKHKVLVGVYLSSIIAPIDISVCYEVANTERNVEVNDLPRILAQELGFGGLQ